jgi:hypothetical protein
MKKEDLKKLALLGVASGLFFSAPAHADQPIEKLNAGPRFMAAHGCGGHAGGRRRRPQFFPKPEEQTYGDRDVKRNDFTGNPIRESNENIDQRTDELRENRDQQLDNLKDRP